MTKVTDDPLPFLPFTETVDPSNPAAGGQRLFVDTDHLLKMVDSSGTVTTFPTSSGAVATDAIWDAAGDLAVGSGANTAAKLTIGAAGGVLARINGAVAWNAGTSFPTAATGDRYFRTDRGMEFYYDGTRWVSLQLFTSTLRMTAGPTVTTTETGDLSSTIAATRAATRAPAPSLHGGTDVWLVDHRVVYIVNSGGTALSGSHKWVGSFNTRDNAAALITTHATVNIDSGSSGVFREATTTIGALQDAGTFYYQGSWTKTGTPGTLQLAEEFRYRLVAT